MKAEPAGTMHVTRFETSHQLRRLLDFLLDGQPHSTIEISHALKICAVSQCCAMLRENGFDARCVKRSAPALYQLINPPIARKLRHKLLTAAGVL